MLDRETGPPKMRSFDISYELVMKIQDRLRSKIGFKAFLDTRDYVYSLVYRTSRDVSIAVRNKVEEKLR